MTDDLALWGATDDDAALLPAPDMRRIGERLFVRPRDLEPGKALRLPLRVPQAVTRRAMDEGAGGEGQVSIVIDALADDFTREQWAELDSIDQARVARRYFTEVRDLLGMDPGESSR